MFTWTLEINASLKHSPAKPPPHGTKTVADQRARSSTGMHLKFLNFSIGLNNHNPTLGKPRHRLRKGRLEERTTQGHFPSHEGLGEEVGSLVSSCSPGIRFRLLKIAVQPFFDL